jgi:hypothetical protein
VDRVEGDVAVLVIGKRQWSLPAALLPEGVTEGDTVEITARKAPGLRPRHGDIDWKEK